MRGWPHTASSSRHLRRGPHRPAPPTLGDPGALEELARRVGLAPVAADEVDVPFEAPDQETLERALLAAGGVVAAIDHTGEHVVRMRIVEAALPFTQPRRLLANLGA